MGGGGGGKLGQFWGKIELFGGRGGGGEASPAPPSLDETRQEATSCLSQGPPHQVVSCYNARHSVARDSVVIKALLLSLSHELLVLPIVRTLQEPYN